MANTVLPAPSTPSIPTSTEDVDTASALIEFLTQPEFLAEYYKVAIYGPVLKAQESMEAFTIPVLAGQLDLVLNALTGLVVMNAMQTVMQGSYMLLREPAQARLVFATWRDSMWVGALSACGSASWFTAFAFAPVALVRAVGQVEMVFTLIFSRFYLKETLRPADVAGLALIVSGVVIVLLGR